ncbi:hypothetical protein SAMN05444920_101921 [Nonomuraea solani]|uniref:DUF2269 family protein n=1 Tax=Nonomuraea solani TaxID=1144553 RepID=A0A1H5VM71_9ACTN|nr:hypothetical protein [Nonomuraea solani]SEF88310.1 hypothetical protein SAMN05444920_101921 [Nonomuraea solani]
MEGFLLSVHVLGAIVFVGGPAVATSLFPKYALADERGRPVAVAMHRITRGYSLFGLVVPVAGMTLASVQGRMGEIWVIVSMVLTLAAGLLLALRIYPRQRDVLAAPGDPAKLKGLSMLAGFYNLLWAAVVVLMIVRPGSAEAA